MMSSNFNKTEADLDALKIKRKELVDLYQQTEVVLNNIKKRISGVDDIIDYLNKVISSQSNSFNIILPKLEELRGAKYNEVEVKLVKQALDKQANLMELYIDTSSSHCQSKDPTRMVFLDSLLKAAEQFLVNTLPDYNPPASFRVYERQMIKNASAFLLGSNKLADSESDTLEASHDSDVEKIKVGQFQTAKIPPVHSAIANRVKLFSGLEKSNPVPAQGNKSTHTL